MTDPVPKETRSSHPPPDWVKKLLPVVLVVGALLVWWSPGGAPADAPSRPCPTITRAEYDAALAAGAAQGTARVAADGTSDLSFGPGTVSCATGKKTLRPCKRPDDLVIAYEAAGAEPFFVRVPAGAEYRFRPARAPNTCEILERS